MRKNNSAIADELRALHQRGDFAAVIAAAERDLDAALNDASSAFLLGLSYASTGALEKAAPALARALALKSDPAVLSAAARVAHLRGQADETERMIAELAAAASAHPAAAHHLAEVYLFAGRAEEAFHVIDSALTSFGAPELDIMLAEAAIRTRRTPIGVASARRAEARFGATRGVVKIAGPAALLGGDEAAFTRMTALVDRAPAPDAAAIYDYWTGVLTAGSFLSHARRAAELAAERAPSAKRWRKVADLRLAAPDLPGAEVAARAALAIAPDDASAMSLLARCRLFSGDVAGAKRIFTEAVAIDPDSAVAFDNLTRIDASAMTGEMATHLERRLAEGAFDNFDRTKALLALARRDEFAGDYARAFERMIEAKAIAARAADAAGLGYKPQETETREAQIKAIFSEPLPALASAGPPRLVFIVGMPRSGTSLAEQILSSHPDVFGAGEIAGMNSIASEFAIAAVDPTGAQSLLATSGAQLIARYRAALPGAAHRSPVVTDKQPLNFWSIGLIRALFPDAGIVNLKRAPVDVCLSILSVRFFTEYSFTNEIDSIAHYYAAYERMMTHWRRLFGEAIYDLDYEALVRDPEGETRALLAYCGLGWNAACLDFHLTQRDVITHSAAQVREPINARALERRAKYGDALNPIEDALARYRHSAL